MLHLLRDPLALKEHILHVLHEKNLNEQVFPKDAQDLSTASSVLFLLGRRYDGRRASFEPCLILNKRSRRVRQPGDLCFPGGGIAPRLDSYLAKLIILTGFPLARWPYWPQWRRQRPHETWWLSLFFATSLRESFEEMRLNPLGVEFLGHLPPRSLVMFRRVIYPMVGWVARQKRFILNWEVEKVIYIPLQNLLNPIHYGRYQLHVVPHLQKKLNRTTDDFACFIYHDGNETELLWGVTYRIVILFLELVFGFKPPPMASFPVVHGILDEAYLRGAR
jgi:8-oxo-dGTP pyrophosphatase MutT (NUDIX family)